MPTVRLEIVPWLSDAWGNTGRGRLIVAEEVAEGETLRYLLRRLAQAHPHFGQYVFDLKNDRLAGFASVVVNDAVLGQAPDLSRALKEGDTIVFLPPYAGGA